VSWGDGGRSDGVRPAVPPRGFSLVELLVVLAVLGILIASAAPLVADTVARERLHAAALETAAEIRGLRQRSVTQRTAFGVRFIFVAGRWSYSVYRDGNGNGIRTADIVSGVDSLLEGPSDPDSRYGGIRFGLPGIAVPAIPPGTGPLPNPSDPIKFGSSNIIGFSPAGSISSGSLYLTDGTRAAAVVVYGPTGRVRVWRFRADVGWRIGG
jgi:prepilin-type N-terminal cleavage/methylation domain-containing protein